MQFNGVYFYVSKYLCFMYIILYYFCFILIYINMPRPNDDLLE